MDLVGGGIFLYSSQLENFAAGGFSCLVYMNNYIVRSYRDVIVITKFAITKFAIRRASKAQNIVMY